MSTPGNARLYVVGSRSAQQRLSATAGKLDSVLADLSRHAELARPGHVLADLHSLSPAARFMQTSAAGAPLVLVDAVTRGDPQQLKSALESLGLERAAVYSNDVGGLAAGRTDRSGGGPRRGASRSAPRCRARAHRAGGHAGRLCPAQRRRAHELSGPHRHRHHRRRALRQLQLLCRVCRAGQRRAGVGQRRAMPPTASRPTMPRTYRPALCRRA